MAILHNSESETLKSVFFSSNIPSIASEPKKKRYTRMLTLPMPAAMTGMEKSGIKPKEMPDIMPLIKPRVCLSMIIMISKGFAVCTTPLRKG